MKIQCDVCCKNEATLFCTADEAALCGDCDFNVHFANKLASKHQRFPLIIPNSSSSNIPMCDICQEKKALLFCQQDRAIICRDCDVAIHTANELTMKHNRFLLTGIKLSPIAAAAAATAPVKVASDSGGCDLVPDFKTQNSNIKNPISIETQVSAPSLNSKGIDANSSIDNDVNSLLIYDSGVGDGGCASSISEYLMEMLPGWQVDDFLDPGSTPFGLSKGSDDDGLISFGDTDLGKNNEVSYSHEMMGIWVPQAPTMAMESPYTYPTNLGFSGFGGEKKMETSKKVVSSRKRMDDGFTVPQISSQAIGSKRSKTFW